MKGKKQENQFPWVENFSGFITILLLTNVLSGIAVHIVASNLRMDHHLVENLSFCGVKQVI